MKYEQEFSAWVRERGDALLRTARLLIPDHGEAEDALQTALLRISRHWPVEAPDAYVRKALVNLAHDRSRRRHLVAEPAEVRDERRAALPDLGDALASQQALEQLLAQLPARQRVTVVLRVLEGYSEADTARVMGCAPGTAKSNLARGLARLRELLPTDTSEGALP